MFFSSQSKYVLVNGPELFGMSCSSVHNYIWPTRDFHPPTPSGSAGLSAYPRRGAQAAMRGVELGVAAEAGGHQTWEAGAGRQLFKGGKTCGVSSRKFGFIEPNMWNLSSKKWDGTNQNQDFSNKE